MGTWRSDEHREDHFVRHGGPLRLRSVEAYDASADETVTIGTPFTYRDRRTGEWRVGYYHRESARFVAVDLDGVTRSHFVTDAADVANLPLSTYRD